MVEDGFADRLKRAALDLQLATNALAEAQAKLAEAKDKYLTARKHFDELERDFRVATTAAEVTP